MECINYSQVSYCLNACWIPLPHLLPIYGIMGKRLTWLDREALKRSLMHVVTSLLYSFMCERIFAQFVLLAYTMFEILMRHKKSSYTLTHAITSWKDWRLNFFLPHRSTVYNSYVNKSGGVFSVLLSAHTLYWVRCWNSETTTTMNLTIILFVLNAHPSFYSLCPSMHGIMS